MSCSLSSRSNTSKLLTIRSGVTDFGMTILPSWICHLISTCAGVFPCRSATEATVGLSSSAPWPSGAHASVATPSVSVHFAQFLLLEHRMQLDLVHGRHDSGGVHQNSQMLRLEVADTDRPDAALVAQVCERLEGLDEGVPLRQGPVDQVEVEVVDTEPIHAGVERP